MAANAPYYQVRSSQFIAAPNSTNATPSHFVDEGDEYDLSATAGVSPHEHHPSLYSERAVGQTSADTSLNTMEENHNLAELLEAATTAAGQAGQAVDAHDVVTASTAVQGRSKRKRAPSSPTDEATRIPRAHAIIGSKRRKVDVPTDPQLQVADHGMRGSIENNSVSPSSESVLSDARAAGIHSAAALFRRTSEKTSRKYTRPPMSKLFMSLQLSPGNFLQLQAQAKSYMLDTSYPERQNCVGNRGKGDTDMVKLRLFNCVRNFLNDGVGEQFFGENVEKPGEREAIEVARALGEVQAPNTEERLTWPRDGNKIISLVTPLMRRMVTNERQRMYAIETRKGGTKKKDKEDSAEAATRELANSPAGKNARGQSIEQHLQPAFDPSLAHPSQTSQPASPLIATPVTLRHVYVADMGRLSQMVEVKPVAATNLPLPIDDPDEPRLSNINIFLVLAAHTMPNGATKTSIKLDQKRIFTVPPHNLTSHPWDELLCEIFTLIQRAKTRFPEVRQRVILQDYHSSGSSPAIDNSNHLTDNLRELAAAANAMQGDNITVGENELIGKHPRVNTITTDANTTLLSRYIIKTVGPNGWEVIDSAEQWNDLLQRRGHEIWADGIINMIVELVDVPVGSERATEGNGKTIDSKARM